MKEKIVQQHLLLLQDKEDVFRDMILGLTIDAQNDAKGSAGDKHETALSMMHLEQEKLTKKLQEIIAQKSILQHIDRTKKHNKITLGSLVKANTIWLFVSADRLKAKEIKFIRTHKYDLVKHLNWLTPLLKKAIEDNDQDRILALDTELKALEIKSGIKVAAKAVEPKIKKPRKLRVKKSETNHNEDNGELVTVDS